MPKKIPPLTEKKIKSAKPKDRAYKLFDGEGLYLYILPTGTKSWRMKYTSPVDKKEKTITFGKYPFISLKEARAKRFEVKALLEQKIEPSLKEEILSFEEVSSLYLRTKNISTGHLNNQLRLLRLHIYPKLATKSIDKISTQDILNTLDTIPRLNSASRAFGLLNSIFKFAMAKGYINQNPLNSIDKKSLIPTSKTKHYPTITKKDEIKKLLKDILSYKTEVVKDAIVFSLLTASRPYNIRFASWSEIEDNSWIIPPEKMKTKIKHIVPLSDWALEILEKAKSYKRGDLIFPSPKYPDRALSINTLNLALKKLGYKDRVVVHGFRAMFSTIAHENIHLHKAHSLAIERQLAHIEKNRVKASYNYAEYLKERQKLMQWWSDWLRDLL